MARSGLSCSANILIRSQRGDSLQSIYCVFVLSGLTRSDENPHIKSHHIHGISPLSCQVTLDGEDLGTIPSGNSEKVNLPFGSHVVFVKAQPSKLKITLEKEFEISNSNQTVLPGRA